MRFISGKQYIIEKDVQNLEIMYDLCEGIYII